MMVYDMMDWDSRQQTPALDHGRSRDESSYLLSRTWSSILERRDSPVKSDSWVTPPERQPIKWSHAKSHQSSAEPRHFRTCRTLVRGRPASFIASVGFKTACISCQRCFLFSPQVVRMSSCPLSYKAELDYV